MQLKLIEPLRELFKDEVRELGAALGLPEKMVQRQIIPRARPCYTHYWLRYTRAHRHTAKSRCHCARGNREPPRPPDKIWQFFAVLLPIKSVGVMGDGRTYEQVCAVRAVSSSDGMTADWAKFRMNY